jgi:hypothetical protein
LEQNILEQRRFALSFICKTSDQERRRTMKQAILLLVCTMLLPAAIRSQGAAYAGLGRSTIGSVRHETLPSVPVFIIDHSALTWPMYPDKGYRPETGRFSP